MEIKELKLMETGIGTNLEVNLKAEGCRLQITDTFKLYDTIFRTLAEVCTIYRKDESTIAATIRDLKGNLILAAVLKWHNPEDEGQVDGNWSFVFTQDEADLEGTIQINVSDSQFALIFSNVGTEMYNMRLSDSLYITKYAVLAINTLKEHLRVNAKENEKLIITTDREYFKAESSIEDGEVVIGFVPGDKLKELIKNDCVGVNN